MESLFYEIFPKLSVTKKIRKCDIAKFHEGVHKYFAKRNKRQIRPGTRNVTYQESIMKGRLTYSFLDEISFATN